MRREQCSIAQGAAASRDPSGDANGSATITLHANFAVPNAEGGAHVMWEVPGGTSTATDHTFASGSDPQVTLTPANGNYDFAATIWVDANGNGLFDSGEPSRTVNVRVYTAQLEFNNTPETSDDIVRLSTPAFGSDIQASQPALDLGVQLLGDAPSGLTVSLDNANGYLGFGTDAPTSNPVTQPTFTAPNLAHA